MRIQFIPLYFISTEPCYSRNINKPVSELYIFERYPFITCFCYPTTTNGYRCSQTLAQGQETVTQKLQMLTTGQETLAQKIDQLADKVTKHDEIASNSHASIAELALKLSELQDCQKSTMNDITSQTAI